MNDAVDAGALWRNQSARGEAPALDVLRAKADALGWQARWRVWSGYGWGGFFAVQCCVDLAGAHNAMQVAGDLLGSLGAVCLALWWRRFATGHAVLNELPLRAFLAAYRDELARQKRLIGQLGIASVTPLLVGIAVSGCGHLAARHALNMRSFGIMVALCGLVLAMAWIMGRLQAEQLRFRIDEVADALRESL